MRQKIFKEFILIVGLFAVLLFAIWYIPWKKNETEILSVAKEQEVGEKLFESIQKGNAGFDLIEKPEVDSILNNITQRLVENEDFNYDYRFEVFDNSMINAFTLPGGIILISSGLIEFTESPEELAAVIAHEMGHVENRHVITRLIRELSINILLSNDAYVLSEVTKSLASNSYSRKQESAADAFALKTLEEAKIEPRILATFFRKVKDKEGDISPYLQAFSTHPNFSTRITACLEYQPADNFEEEKFDINWEEAKTHFIK